MASALQAGDNNAHIAGDRIHSDGNGEADGRAFYCAVTRRSRGLFFRSNVSEWFLTVITLSVGFQGTSYITAMMLVASLFLLCWDWNRLRAIVFEPTQRPVALPAPTPLIEKSGYVVGTVAALVVSFATRGLAPMSALLPMLGVGLVAVVLVLVGWMQTVRR